MKHLNYKLLYYLWAAMFGLTAMLGLCFPQVETAGERVPLLLAAVAFFLPPWGILRRAGKEKARKHILVVRYLSLLSLGLTVVLLCMNLLSAGRGEAVGNGLYAVLTVVSAPMVCSNFYLVPLFLWATLLMGSFGKK